MVWTASLVEAVSVLLVALTFGLGAHKMFRDLRDAAAVVTEKPEDAPAAAPIAAESPVSGRAFLGITAVTLASRAVVFLVGYLLYLGITGERIGFLASFQTIWAKWDSAHYLNLAQNWYRATGDDRFLIVFYPLYPLTVRLMHLVIGDYFWAGVAVSIVSLVGAAYFLQELVRLEFGDSAIARNAVMYLLVFPLSFFFAMAYTESLFLLLSVLTFYFCRRDRWLAAGIAGLLAALTRNLGLLLVVPLAIELVYRYRRRGTSLRQTVSRAACVALVPVGSALYLVLNKVVTGDWLRFLEYQHDHWRHDFIFFGTNLAAMAARVFESDARLTVGTWVPGVALFFFTVLIVAAAARELPPSYTAYSLAYLVTAYSASWLLSGPRYIAGMFPLFVAMALLARGHDVRRRFMEGTSALLLGFMMAMFIQSAVM